MFGNDDDMVDCPYNKTHRMLRKRLQSHLLKCRLNYPDVELRKCPFNITHLVPEPEFGHHATNCPDRKLITQYKYDAPEPKEEDRPRHAPIECDENWDDTDVNDYNPKLYLDQANVLRQPDGANRSERKLFIKKERRRLGDDSDSCDEETESNVSYPVIKCQRDKSYDSVNDRGNSTYDSSAYYGRDLGEGSTSCKSESPTSSRKSKERSRTRSRSPTYKPRYDGSRSPTNNQYNSGRDPYYNSSSSNAYYDRTDETDDTMPVAPPPPMISYPSRRAYMVSYPSQRAHFSPKPPSSASGR